MKKKQFTSKLQFQKTTVVSFKAMGRVRGGAIQNGETIPLSDPLTCGTRDCLNETLYDTCACMSVETNVCTRPTNTQNGATDFCGGSDEPTKMDCLETRRC
ncbi:hypothetical protein [Kordia zhangzhouensis]|uniref:hypothetical protein n=1 Tax=Kordia zhangzhouensis TaxID=1620405 RepID=UPI000629517F|nr:hypothetical protein [Kordia zhangzhouensis]